MAQRRNRRELMEIAQSPESINPHRFDVIFKDLVAIQVDQDLSKECPEKIASMEQDAFDQECIHQMKIRALQLEIATH